MNAVPAEISRPKVVSREQWLEARRALLAREKELTRLRDQLNEQRRELPWVKVDKNYVFECPKGEKVTLAELFNGRSQLIVHHFMLGPGELEGCVGCSFMADSSDGIVVHLMNHDVSYVRVSRAPIAEIEAFRQRMGWTAPWLSSYGSDFNYDFNVSFRKEDLARGEIFYNFERQPMPYGMEDLHGVSVFCKDEAGDIYHTYSCYARGAEGSLTAYFYLDITQKGRNETLNGNLTDWVRHHDRYGAGGHVDATGHYVADASANCECATQT